MVLGTLVLSRNIFKGDNPEQSRKNILQMPIPDFRALDPRIDKRLNEILQRTLARNPNDRYPNADELLYDLEYYIYHSGYGPTNETLGKMARDLFGLDTAQLKKDVQARTAVLEETARLKATQPRA